MPLKCPAEWSLLLPPPPPLGVPLHKGALCVCGHLHRRPLHTCVRTSFCMLSGRMGQWWAADDVCRMVRRLAQAFVPVLLSGVGCLSCGFSNHISRKKYKQVGDSDHPRGLYPSAALLKNPSKKVGSKHHTLPKDLFG